MRTFTKIVKITLVTILTMIVVLAILSAILEPQITRLFLQKTNKSLKSHIEIGSINFSLLRSFPQASVELRDLILFSPPLSRGSEQTEDTLLLADRIFVSLKITGLLKKQYIIDKISLDRGSISIIEDQDGSWNMDILRRSENSDTSIVNIELRNIRINNTHLTYISHSRIIETDLDIINAESRLTLSSERSKIELSGLFVLNALLKEDFRLSNLPSNIKASTSLTIEPDNIICDRASLELPGSDIGLNFSFARSERVIAAAFTISETDLESVLKYLTKEEKDKLSDNLFSGTVSATGTFDGLVAKNNLPLLKASLTINKGAIKIPGKDFTISSVSANGSIEIDPDDPSTSFSLKLPSFSATVNRSSLYGSLDFKNIKQPYIDLIATGDIESSDLVSLISTTDLEVSGIVRTNMRLFGRMPARTKPLASDLLKLNRSVSLNLRTLKISLPSYGIFADKLNGNIMISDNIWLDGISFTLDKSIMVMNGMLGGFNDWLSSPEKPLTLSAGLWANRFNTAMITDIAGRIRESEIKEKSGGILNNISLNLDLKLDSLIINKFGASMLAAEINYNNNFINIPTFHLNSLGGDIEGNAAIARLTTGKYVGKGWFDINSIDINKTFTVFSNFGQQHITDKNLSGRFTGSLNVTSEFLPGFKPDLNTLKLSGSYSITDGELNNFEPAMKLSKFIELSELSNIRFSELQNSIIIEDRAILIPSMEIASSAFDISLSGSHSFDGIYTYHLKLLLSDLLSRKARVSSSKVSEFGVIEDDGLGKSSLYLRIDGSKGVSKVSYDVKSLKGNIKKSVDKEKGNLRTILKEEYGWYAGDTITPKPKAETRKFRIVWEEADSIKIVEPPEQDKPLPLKNIFRKKKGGTDSN